FTVADERYARLQLIGTAAVLADHEHEGIRHPLIWTREIGAARCAYDGLGHDTRSFDSEPHREIIRRLARWAARASRRSSGRVAALVGARGPGVRGIGFRGRLRREPPALSHPKRPLLGAVAESGSLTSGTPGAFPPEAPPSRRRGGIGVADVGNPRRFPTRS